MNKKAYIAGPMTGKMNWNFPAFHEAARILRAEGYDVNNPAEHSHGETKLPRATYMRQAYQSALDSDVIFVLPGWKESLGATEEVLIAMHIGTPVHEFEGRALVTELGCILLEAREAVLSKRAKTYGHPSKNLGKTAEFWESIFSVPVTAEQVGYGMVALKLARALTGEFHRDNLVDAAGYMKTVEMIMDGRDD
jgi:hypothetical protein